MNQYYDEDKNKYTDDLDEFTLELMIGIVGEKNMFFEIQERNSTNHNMKNSNLSMKDRFESAKIESESKSQCKTQEKSFCEER